MIFPVQSWSGVGGQEGSIQGRYRWDTGEHSQVCEHAEGMGVPMQQRAWSTVSVR